MTTLSTSLIAENVLRYLGVPESKKAAQLIEYVINEIKGTPQQLTKQQAQDVETVLANYF